MFEKILFRKKNSYWKKDHYYLNVQTNEQICSKKICERTNLKKNANERTKNARMFKKCSLRTILSIVDFTHIFGFYSFARHNSDESMQNAYQMKYNRFQKSNQSDSIPSEFLLTQIR